MPHQQIKEMSVVSIVFPHQLFEKHPALLKSRTVYLVEEFLFFWQYNFHKQKLVFNRASMKAYQNYLQSKGYEVSYVEAKEKIADVRNLLPYLKQKGISEIHYCDVTDNFLEKRMTQYASTLNIEIKKYNSPLFILTHSEVSEYFFSKKRFFQTDFYTKQRKHFKILVDEKLQPAGGKWTFDAENRLKYPKGKKPPIVTFPEANEYWDEAIAYVKKNFSSNYGEVSNSFIYPTTLQESREWLKQFLQYRFSEFGE
jgi:deoxyribodipyrimidine photolyase-related protein